MSHCHQTLPVLQAPSRSLTTASGSRLVIISAPNWVFQTFLKKQSIRHDYKPESEYISTITNVPPVAPFRLSLPLPTLSNEGMLDVSHVKRNLNPCRSCQNLKRGVCRTKVSVPCTNIHAFEVQGCGAISMSSLRQTREALRIPPCVVMIGLVPSLQARNTTIDDAASLQNLNIACTHTTAGLASRH